MDQGFSLHDMPIYFKIGSVGAGLGAGCGVGIGFGAPLNLGAVPAVGQAIAGISSGLGQVGGFPGGAGSGVREAVRRLGVKGLDAGLGCGVGVGYGFGAGLFLKPSAAEQLVQLVEHAAGNLARHAQAKLQQAGLTWPGGGQPGGPQPAPLFAQHVTQHLPPGGGIGSSLYGAIGSQDPAAPQEPYAHQRLGAGPLGPLSASAWQQQQQQQATQPYHATAASPPPAPSPGESASLPAHASNSAAASTSSTTTSHAPSSQARCAREPSAEEFRALLRHERQIARLRAQNRALRRAVCKLDRRLSICKETSDDDDDENGGVGGL